MPPTAAPQGHGAAHVVELDDRAFPGEAADARAERAWGVDIAALDRDCASPVTPRCTKEELPFGGPIARVRDPGTRLEPAA